MGDLGVTYKVHLWLDGKRVVDFLLAVIELFSLALTVAALLSEICRNRRFSDGVGHFERKFQGAGVSSTNEFWRQKTRFPGLSRCVVCMILHLALLIQYRRVTNTHARNHGY